MAPQLESRLHAVLVSYREADLLHVGVAEIRGMHYRALNRRILIGRIPEEGTVPPIHVM